MQGADVYRVLRGKAIDKLYHANTVTTSCTFLQLGGLASRGHVADRRLPQTPQSSDAIDQKYGIWHDVFVDTVDIHHRTSTRNWYGPVLFVLDAGILNVLPPGSEVLVTKQNPTKWVDGESEDARFYTTPAYLEASLTRGTFDQMIVIRTHDGILSFPKGTVSIVVDDPQRALSNGTPAFRHATTRIDTASGRDKTRFATTKRICQNDCNCVQQYGSSRDFDQLFR